MALALCLTLLPAPARAEEADAPEGGTIVQEEQQEKAPAAESPAILEQAAENGIAAQNGGDGVSVQSGGDGIAVQAASAEKTESSVASVVIDGKTSYYDTLREAIMAAGEKPGSDGTPPTITLLQDGVDLSYPQYNSAEKRDDPTYPVIVDMGGNSLSSVYFLYDTLTLTGGTVNGTSGADIRSGGSLIMTAPADADAAINGLLQVASVGSGTASVSGANIGVKGTLHIYTSAAGAVVISGSDKAVELSKEATLSGCRLYGSAEKNGSPDTVAVYSDGTYTVDGEVAKTLVSGPQAVVAVTPDAGDIQNVMAGETQEYTARYTAEGVVTGSVKGLGDLQATVENGDEKGITVTTVENAADGTWKVTVQTAESTPLGTYTLNLLSAVDGAVSGSVTFTVSETKYAASVGEQNYRSLSAAVDAAKATSGTVKLLENVTGSITVTDGKFTIDLNGKTWTGASDSRALTVNGGEVTLSSTGGAGTIVGSDTNKFAVRVDSGTVHLKENVTLSNRIYIADQNGGSVTFEPGVTVTQNIMTSSHSVVRFLDGLALQNASKAYVPFHNVHTNKNPLGYVTVVAHPAHHKVDGVCDQCGYVCGHSNAKAEDTVCPDCGAKFIATATAADGTTKKHYTNADAALAAAAGNAKVTFVPGTYMLKNTVIFSGRIETEIDLNGATLQYASGDQGVVLQIMESYENITITLKNGTVQNTGKGTGIGLYSTTYGSTRTVLTLEDVTVIGGTNEYSGYSINVANRGNTLTVKSGSFSGPLNLNLANTVKLYGGTYRNGITGSMYRGEDWQDKLSAEDYAALLDNSDPAKQYAYADGAGSVITYDEVATRMNDSDSTNNSIQVKEHTHTMGGTNTCTQCGFVCTAHQYKNGVCAICKAECPHANVDTSTRVCSDCGLTMVAAVTVKDNDVTTYAADLSDALDAAENGATVTLLADAAVGTVPLEGKTVTLDLNGKTVKNSGGGSNNILVGSSPSSASLIITGRGSFISESLTLVVKNGTLDLSQWTGDDSYIRNVTISGANSRFISPTGAGEIYTLAFTDSDTEQAADTASLNGGRYDEIAYERGKTIKLGDLLAKGHAFRQNGTFLEYAKELKNNDTVEKVEVVRCTSHVDADGDKLCDYCNTDLNTGMVATSETGGATYYYTDLSAALAKVSTDGGTVKLLNNVTVLSKPLTIENKNGHNITLDLNGKTLQTFPGDANTFLQVLGNVTICDSSDAKSGMIGSTTSGDVCVSSGTLTITGGTFDCLVVVGNGGNMKISGGIFAALETRNNTAIRTLLADGYGLKRSGGSWLTEENLTGTTAAQVTAEAAPLTSVAISVTPGTTVEYGQSVKLNLEYTTNPTGISVKHKWYSVDETDIATEIQGANDTEYTPTNLSVGEHKYRVTATADGYSKSADITITVEKIDLANATVTIDPWHADGKFRFYPYASETAALSFLSVVTVTANGEKYPLNSDDYTYEGATATRVGKYTLTITAKDSCVNYKGSKTFDWEVIPHQLYRPTFQGSQTYTKTYDGTTTLPGSYTWLADFSGKEGSDQKVTLKSGDYEVTAAEFVSADAGENKPINQTITLKNENFVFSPTEIIKIPGITTTDKTLTYTNFTPTEAYPTGGTTFNIEKAPMPDFDKEVTLDIVNNHADTYTVDLSALLPKLESPRTYGEIKYSQPTVQLASGYYTDGNAKVENGKLILTIDKNPITTTGSIGTVTVQVTTTNYKPVTLTVNLRSVNKRKLGMFVYVATDPIVYGMTLGDIKLSAEATVDKQVIPGTIAWEDPLTTVPAAGRATYRWTFTPDDTMHYLTASNTITFLVDKATPTGAPTYTAITTGGKTLADAPLTPNASWPSGTVQWVDKDGKPLPASTQVQANTKYTWSFTPADAANYNGATGSVTLYAVSSGGGGSSSGGGSDRDNSGSTGKTETTTKPDGTTVKTETKKDGSTVKTETKKDGSSVTENKAANGSTGTVKTDKNGQTTAETALSSKAIEDAKKSGEPVKAPVEVEATRNSNTAPTVKIELPRNSGDTKVEIPVSNVKPGTVAVLVHPDGTEEIVKNSLPTEDGIQLTVNGGATVKIVDNSKDFIDTRNHWAKDAIDFVSARELVNGMNDSIYAPNNSTTRAQLWTILARQNDADLNGGNTWYEKAQLWSKDKGISDGANPNGTINRAQMVTMLWRAMGQPAAASGASFSDVPADSYYAQAVAWAIENGITAGVGGGRFDPNSTCTRGQIATFLWRAMAE